MQEFYGHMVELPTAELLYIFAYSVLQKFMYNSIFALIHAFFILQFSFVHMWFLPFLQIV